MRAFRPKRAGMPRRLYDLIYVSIESSVKSFAHENPERAALGGRIMADIIAAAASDALDDLFRDEKYLKAITKQKRSPRS